ncbi:two-component response regulator containing a CheY-like receiver domain and an HD-GYP domain [Desulforapulum autotrophicum HRM2]|uniref:Two-component response regulator containing a CheY-like receiver domain and an HD-GYP domain n=1 Tax=Desulforapulum autotrophicum (strain ATCC 43914 / DSM 3382 / VKM B-1955 / HRM2) TaxID=177437 RepID=C0QAN6_DESAH|nr:response regulator [Desulforapulum autotrophicum]ACN16819.1 two-component response regulator containing a CheY-like receiver domain and an HD-GYP domain [Desulforapulum autotrophicum HRM2]
MEERFHHTVLVVGTGADEFASIEHRLTKIGVTVMSVDGGEQGLEKIKVVLKPFSIIIADQHLPDMQGHDFLERAKKLTPDSVRFLVTGNPSMDVIIAAVNRGAIHRYILKPLDTEAFFNTVRSGLSKYEVVLENVRLLALAKEQNAKLYMYNCDLKDRSESHQKTIGQLDQEIRKIILAREQADREEPAPMVLQGIFMENGLLTREKMDIFYKNLMGQLFVRFQEIAEKKGFSMPETIDARS